MKEITAKQIEILTMYDQGVSIMEIARSFKLSETSIRAQLKRIAKKSRTIDLPLLPIEEQ